jgi:hypothetical protein
MQHVPMITYALFVLIYFATLCVLGMVIYRQRAEKRELREAMEYVEIRLDTESPVGNLELFDSLQKSVHTLNRRLVRLLDSPKLYLRARRVVGTLDLSDEELTAELEVIHIAELAAA